MACIGIDSPTYGRIRFFSLDIYQWSQETPGAAFPVVSQRGMGEFLLSFPDDAAAVLFKLRWL